MKSIVLLTFMCIVYQINAQSYAYKIDLLNFKKDKIGVELNCPKIETDTAMFNFPMTVPGTYAVLNYGVYISDFKALDVNKKSLKVIKSGKNTYTIFGSKQLKYISYKVKDTWDSKVKENKIFDPCGNGFEAGKYFFINNGGLFGFFNNQLNMPFSLEFAKPSNLSGFTSLKCTNKTDGNQSFSCVNYHELIDNPILFTIQKEAHLKVANADITVASYYQNSDSSAFFISEKLDSCMRAIETFVGGKLPISNYNFLNYVLDFRDVGRIVMSGKIKIYQYPKLIRKTKKHGSFGALEHGTSSSYFLPDFGHNSYTGMVTGTAIHEFMHIYEPLSLHSDLVGNFDYVHPKMSEHLWLYEGITEYFATIIEMQGKLSSVDAVLKHDIRDKIIQSYQYPDSIPFTVMSANVFQKPYVDLYNQVYERGAIMGLLLDIEIMKLTNGEKTLKDVIFQLVEMYGKNKSFKEDEIIPVFVKLVDPRLQQFFDKYVTGTTPLDIEGGLKEIGISYQKEKKGLIPIELLSADNGVTANNNIVINNKVTINKAVKNNAAGFMVGDKVDRDDVVKCYKKANGQYVSEGEMIHLPVIRKGETVELSFPAHFVNGVEKNAMEIMDVKSKQQEKLFYIWSTGKKGEEK